jgi:hypothetical protein
MRALIAAVVLVAATAHADDTFEAKAQGAQRVKRIENVVWALTATCDKGNDTENRQCRHVRDTRAAELAGATLLVDGDADAFDVTAYDAKKKSVALSLSACVRCSGVDVDGKSWVVTGGGAKLYDNAKPFSDASAAKAWVKAIGNTHVQLLVKLPPRPVEGPKSTTVKVDVVGYRVISPCDGAIVVANPPSSAAEPDKLACRAVAAEPAPGAPVAQLTPAIVSDAMKDVVAAAKDCFEKLGVAGKAKLKLTITGDGYISRYEQQGDFAGTATGTCIDKALEKARFPASGKPKTTISYPINLP